MKTRTRHSSGLLRAGGTAGSSRTGRRSARDRFERRAAAARRRPKLLAGIALGLVVLVGGLLWLGWFSSWVTVTTVRVEGTRASAAPEVRRVAQVRMGTPIMRVDTEAVAQRLIEHRIYSTVAVSRRPPHTIVISVRPRIAALALKNAAGDLELVDEDGVRFRTVAAAPEGVPVVTPGPDPGTDGSPDSAPAQVTPAGLKAAVRAVRALDATTRGEVSEITVTAADHVTLSLSTKAGRRTVVWGGQGAEQTKSRLVAILAEQPGTVIDVSVPSSPITR